ncbi:MAG: PadR family transcriptional regulator, partial [Clostridia bacterium]|nr:PadR family transcriptional regulator [Clostridia bacterium]
MGDFTFLNGNIETIILCSLYNNDKYGYEIAKEIKERTSNKYEIKQPTLYSYLKRLEEDDLIVSYWGENSNGGRRRYYKLTKTGKDNCKQFISEWQY